MVPMLQCGLFRSNLAFAIFKDLYSSGFADPVYILGRT